MSYTIALCTQLYKGFPWFTGWYWPIRFDFTTVSLWWFWSIRFDVTIVSTGNNCKVKHDWPEQTYYPMKKLYTIGCSRGMFPSLSRTLQNRDIPFPEHPTGIRTKHLQMLFFGIKIVNLKLRPRVSYGVVFELILIIVTIISQ